MQYIKKPIPINALQWTGNNVEEILDFMSNNHPIFESNGNIVIRTLEGEMRAAPGSYIIQGIEGEFYPCRKDIFEKTYTPKCEKLINCNNCHKNFSLLEIKTYYDSLANKYKYWAICPYCGIKNDWEN